MWNHAAVSRRRDADAPAVIAALPGCYGVFLPDDCAPLRWAVRGGPASTSPRWPLAEFATQLRTLPTMPPSPRLSLSRRCRLPEFSTSLTPHSLGSDSTIFSRPPTLSRQQAVGVTGISSSPCCRIMRQPSGRAVRPAARGHLPFTWFQLIAPRLRLHATQWDDLSSTAACPDAYSPL